MLEYFILSFCLSRTSDNACLNAATAYSKYTHLDKEIDYNSKLYASQYKDLAYVTSVISTINNKQFNTPLGSSKFILNLDLTNSTKCVILYRYGW